MTRPKSTTANRRTSSSGATIANSTNDWLLCDRRPLATVATLEASNDHVGVHRYMHRVAQYAGHEPSSKSERHHDDDVHVRTLIAVVGGRGIKIENGRVGVEDLEERRIMSCTC